MRKLAPLLLLICATARAHDFWIEPSTFRPAPGVTFTASLLVGQDFGGDVVPRNAALIEKFVVRDAAGEHAVNGFENQDPAGYVRLDTAGVAVIGYRSRPVPLALTAAKFEESLRLEGLDSIIALRKARGESQKPDKEIFSRCAKAIIVAGGGAATGRAKEPLGFRLELVPESGLGSGPLTVRLLYEGKPLANALIVALQRDDPALRVQARSDAAGRVTLPLAKGGVWLIKSVHIIPAPAASGAEWESLWASLTFER
jgi:uncharacterized GH25 family protein